jgi:hypothetical protein
MLLVRFRTSKYMRKITDNVPPCYIVYIYVCTWPIIFHRLD